MKLNKLLFFNSNGFDIHDQPVAIGIPLPAGTVDSHGRIHLLDEYGQVVEHAQRVLSSWSDGSVRWMHMEFSVSVKAGQRRLYQLNLTAGVVSDREPECSQMKNRNPRANSDAMVFESGGVCFQLNPADGQVLATVEHGSTGKRSISTSRVELVDEEGRRNILPVVEQHWTKSASGYSSEIKTICEFRHAPGAQATTVTLLQTCFANSALSRIEVCLHNPNPALHPGGVWDLGDPGSLRFKELSIIMQGPPSSALKWQEHIGESWRETNNEALSIDQVSSGGDQWDSPVHATADGKNDLAFCGYQVSQELPGMTTGKRCEPVLLMDSGDFQMTVRPEGFWQRFPKGMHANAQECCLGMFPKIDGVTHELQGGESSTYVTYLGFDNEAGTLEWVNHPLQMSLDTASVFRTHALKDWQNLNLDPGYGALLATGLEGENSFFQKRENVDEYGWRHFGELYADHETWKNNHEGIFVSHYNNQYDPIYGFARLYLQTGEARYHELMSDLARHVLDIDIYRTDADRAEYNQGLFWHTDHYVSAYTATHRTYSRQQQSENHDLAGGGPGGQHCYTSGLRLYYLLTGNERAREAVFDLTKWITCVYEGTGSVLERMQTTMVRDLPEYLKLLKGKKVWRYRYPLDRGVGNYIRALLDCHELDGRDVHLARIGELIRGTVGPSDDVGERGLDDVEKTWFYTIFFQAVVVYLDTKREIGVLDADFHYARSALLCYTDWMLANEEPYLASAEKLEYVNDTWVAQDARKAALLHAAYRYSLEGREAFLAQALYFKNYVIETLGSSDTVYYTRIQAILMQNHDPVGKEWVEQPPYSLGAIPLQSEQNCYSTFGSHTRYLVRQWRGCLRDFSLSRELTWLKHRFPKFVPERS